VQFTSAGGFGQSHSIDAPIVVATDTSFFSSVQQGTVALFWPNLWAGRRNVR